MLTLAGEDAGLLRLLTGNFPRRVPRHIPDACGSRDVPFPCSKLQRGFSTSFPMTK